jgi:DNA-binding NarL/FixJ family response regulator
MGAQFRLSWQQYVGRQLESVRRTLTEEERTAAWEEGRAMTLEQAIAYALNEPERQEDEARPSAAGVRSAKQAHIEMTYPQDLTAREVEVLGLLAAGKTNKEIATELFLSVSTVQRHVANIYAKIGAHGRAEATAYALTRGLAHPSEGPLEP